MSATRTTAADRERPPRPRRRRPLPLPRPRTVGASASARGARLASPGVRHERRPRSSWRCCRGARPSRSGRPGSPPTWSCAPCAVSAPVRTPSIVTTLRLPGSIRHRGVGRRDPRGGRCPHPDVHAGTPRDARHHRRDLGRQVGAVAAVVLGGGSSAVGSAVSSAAAFPVAATVGALVAAVAVYRPRLAWWRAELPARPGRDRGVSATLDAVTSYLLVRAQITQATAASQWLVGSLASTSWSSVSGRCSSSPWSPSPSPSPRAPPRHRAARGRGRRRCRARHPAAPVLVIALAVVLTAAAVAAAGPVGFVASSSRRSRSGSPARTARHCCCPPPSVRCWSWS